MRGSVLLVAMGCLLPLAAAEVEEDPDRGSGGIIATEWAVKQDIEELFRDLRDERQSRPRLFDRVVGLLRRDGDKIYLYDGVYLCVRDAVLRELERLELGKAFFAYTEPLARHRLDEVLRRGADDDDLRVMATQFPGTPAAGRAWQLLADRSWDRGNLDRYLNYADRSGEAEDPARARRLALAMRLIGPRRQVELPDRITKAHPIWRLDLARVKARTGEDERTERERQLHHLMQRQLGTPVTPRPTRIALDRVHNLAAVVTEETFQVVDPVVGRVVLGPQGIERLPGSHLALGAGGTGVFAAITKHFSNQALLYLVNGLRGERRKFRLQLAPNSIVSDPVITDRLIVFAEVINTRSGLQLSLHAHALDDGRQVWSTLIGQSSHGRDMAINLANQQPPVLVKHLGRYAVASNTGIMALLDSDGNIKKIWAYRRFGTPLGGEFPPRTGSPQSLRAGRIAADDRHIVFAPADSNRQLIYDCLDDELSIYDGPDSNGHLLGCSHDRAVVAGERLRCLSLPEGRSLWDTNLQTYHRPSYALMDDSELLLVQDRYLSHYDLADGRRRGTGRDLLVDATVAVVNGILLVSRRDHLVGYGDCDALAAQYTRLAEREPDAYEPLLALAAIAEKNHDGAAALDLLRRALERGAPRDHVGKAAAILRRDLQGQLGREGFAGVAARFAPFLRFEPGYAAELDWWRGRDREVAGDAPGARALYAEALERPSRMVDFPDGCRVQTRQLALAGLHRLGDPRRPRWHRGSAPAAATEPPTADPDPDAAPLATEAWRNDDLHTLGPPLVDGDTCFAFCDGNLIAIDLRSGAVSWRRPPNSRIDPFLGVALAPAETTPPIRVIPGTAAQRMGLQDGDRILRFQGRELGGHADLTRAVADLEFGDEFQLTVDRQGRALTLRSRIGSRPVQPVAVNRNHLVTRKVACVPNADPMLRPETRSAVIDVYDRDDGTLRWRRPLRAEVPAHLVHPPILSPADHLLLVDGADIVAYDIRPPADPDAGPFPARPTKLWTIPGAAGAFADLRVLSPRMAVYPDPDDLCLRFLDLDDGGTLAEVPCHPDQDYLLRDGRLILRRVDGRLAAWDLELGELLWHSRRWSLSPLAWAADGLFARNLQHHLVLLDETNGTQRRYYPSWSDLSNAVEVGDHLVFHARRKGETPHIVAVGRGSGTVVWQRVLPGGLELRGGLLVSERSLALRLYALERSPSVMLLDPADGGLLQGRVLRRGEEVVPYRGGLVLLGPHGMRRCPEQTLRPAPPLVPAVIPPDEEDLAAVVRERHADQEWNALSDAAAYALARRGETLLVFVRLSPTVAPVDVHLGDSASPVPRAGSFLRFRHGGSPRFHNQVSGESWRYVKVAMHEDGERRVYCAALAPPVLRDPTASLRIHVEGGGDDDASIPWWVTDAWREIGGFGPADPPSPDAEDEDGGGPEAPKAYPDPARDDDGANAR